MVSSLGSSRFRDRTWKSYVRVPATSSPLVKLLGVCLFLLPTSTLLTTTTSSCGKKNILIFESKHQLLLCIFWKPHKFQGLPTQTVLYHEGNLSNMKPYILHSLIPPQKWVIQWPMQNRLEWPSALVFLLLQSPPLVPKFSCKPCTQWRFQSLHNWPRWVTIRVLQLP